MPGRADIEQSHLEPFTKPGSETTINSFKSPACTNPSTLTLPLPTTGRQPLPPNQIAVVANTDKETLFIFIPTQFSAWLSQVATQLELLLLVHPFS
jgi:hypothetical protein